VAGFAQLTPTKRIRTYKRKLMKARIAIAMTALAGLQVG